MAPIEPVLNAFFSAALITSLAGSMADLPGRESKQKQIQWEPFKRWTLRLALWSLVLTVPLFALYLAHVPSFSYVDGQWVAGPRDAWPIAILGVMDLAVLALLLDRLALVLRNPRTSLTRRLARSTALVLAAAVAFAGFYTHLTS